MLIHCKAFSHTFAGAEIAAVFSLKGYFCRPICGEQFSPRLYGLLFQKTLAYCSKILLICLINALDKSLKFKLLFLKADRNSFKISKIYALGSKFSIPEKLHSSSFSKVQLLKKIYRKIFII